MTTCLCGCEPAEPFGRTCPAGLWLKTRIRSRWERWLKLKGTSGSTRADRDAAYAEYQEARKELKAHHEAEAGPTDQESVTP